MALYVWGKICGLNDANLKDNERTMYFPTLFEHFGGSVITDYAAGENHALAVTEFGDVYSWGRGNDGELGHGDRESMKIPKKIKGLEDQIIKSVACGNVHSLATTISGQVYMWGLLHDPTAPDEEEMRENNDAMGMLHGISSVAQPNTEIDEAPELHFFERIVRDAEARFAEGENEVTDFEQGMTKVSLFRSRQLVPRLCTSLVGRVITKVAAGFGHSIVIDSFGQAYSCGYNDNGQLGLNHVQIEPEFVKIEAFNGKFVKDIACGQQHNLALVVESPVEGSFARCYSWGLGAFGQLGLGTRRSILAPEEITFLQNSVVSIATGSHHSVAVDVEGFVYTWGHSEYGQHGVAFNGHDLYDNRKYFVPVKHENFQDIIVSVTCGSHFTVATDIHGVLHSWGWNSFGVLGTGRVQMSTLPQVIENLRGFSICRTQAGYNQCGAIVRYLGLPYAMGFQTLLSKAMFSDVTLVAKGTSVPAHKVFLKARCPQLYGYIRVSLAHNEDNSTSVELDLPEITGFDALVLKALLTYLYVDRLEISSHKLPVLSATDLQTRCAHHRKSRGVVAPEPQSCFSHDMKAVVLDTENADIWFAWPLSNGEERLVPGHKAILSQVPYFDAIFSGRFREGGEHISLAGMVADGFDVTNFELALEWLYTGNRSMLEELDLNEVVDLVMMGNILGIESLISVCTLQLAALVAKDPNEDLLSTCWEVADRLDLSRLKTQCQVLLDALHS
ncbi:regulator of chromosome condensation (RCC1) [Thraustotheca clavata]|uniref:Regulator of chromosome condensation (RCC1) n=1 Tax=Thraustotheca clavata TaxID=74557 RepID=A0A1W0A3Z1_9STRA|nr:regulator of chromosome condensation (RCC1) [Thraustotheca clavata]